MFISFEGIDGCGKTTQARLLAEALRREGADVVLTREPGGTPLGEEVRRLLLHGDHVAPWAEAALYAGSRAQHVKQVIRPALERGASVVCDRYVDSSVAYQGGARGLGVDRVLELNLAVVEGLMPDCTILLEVPSSIAAARLPRDRDRLEREDDPFRARVADSYRELATRFASRFVVIDGARAPAVIAEEIHGAVRGRP